MSDLKIIHEIKMPKINCPNSLYLAINPLEYLLILDIVIILFLKSDELGRPHPF